MSVEKYLNQVFLKDVFALLKELPERMGILTNNINSAYEK